MSIDERFQPMDAPPKGGLVRATRLPKNGLIRTDDEMLDMTATAWRVFYSDGNGDVAELALGASGTVLQSAGATSAPTFATPSLSAYKAADQSVTSSTTLVVDNALSITLVAATNYWFRLWLYVSMSAGGGYKADLDGGTATMTNVRLVAKGDQSNSADAKAPQILTAIATDFFDALPGAVEEYFYIEGTLEVNAGGTLIPRLAQNTSHADASTNKRGSMMLALPI